MENEFSVYQFFEDDSCEAVSRFVACQTAIDVAIGLARSVGAKIGTTKRIIITDGGDFTSWEWVRGKGITFPKEFEGKLI